MMAFIRKKTQEKKAPSSTDTSMKTPEQLLQFAQKNNIDLYPLDVSRLTILLGIKMRLEPLKGEDSGCLYKDNKSQEWIMLVNSLHHPNRQRFTIAHEIAHYLMHSKQLDFFKDEVFFRNGESNIIEIEANRFAAELLMPSEAFSIFIKQKSTLVADIANYFGVSAMAVRIRAQQLGYQGHNL